MSAIQNRAETVAGQIAWTRDLARDLFPSAVTPFHWTLLRQPAHEALQRAWAGLGAALPSADCWRRGPDGYVYLNAELLAHPSGDANCASWLAATPQAQGGLLGRWQTSGAIKRAQALVDAAAQGVDGLNGRLAGWLDAVQRSRWTQADLLQVMEELEPRAQEVLQSYFTVRAGLSAAQCEVAGRLAAWLPDCPLPEALHLYAGLDGLPSVEAAYALAGLRAAPDRNAALRDFLARCGHRGPGEMRPDARRWRDHAAAALQLSAQIRGRDPQAPRAARQAAEDRVLSQLEGGQRRQFDMLLARARRLCRAVDVAWDGLARVMAAAQAWLSAAAMEATAAGLIDHPAEACLLELEELKQVATGEWHRGRSARVRAEVMQRQVELNACAGERPRTPVAAAPGAARGPVVRLEALDSVLRLQGAIMVAQVADPGCAPYWLAAAAVVDGAGDPWTPGMIVARALAAPAVTGMPGAAMPGIPGAITFGQHVAVDGGSGRFEPVPA